MNAVRDVNNAISAHKNIYGNGQSVRCEAAACRTCLSAFLPTTGIRLLARVNAVMIMSNAINDCKGIYELRPLVPFQLAFISKLFPATLFAANMAPYISVAAAVAAVSRRRDRSQNRLLM